MPSRCSFDIKGPGLYFVTTTANNRRHLFESRQPAFEVLRQFAITSLIMDVSIVAYVLMPSHFHALIGFDDRRLLSKYIESFKSLSSRKVKQLNLIEFNCQSYNDEPFSLWQPGFDDVLICSEKQFKIKMDYIHNNPVKAGLVSKAEDFLFSSAGDWLGCRKGLIVIDKGFGWLAGV